MSNGGILLGIAVVGVGVVALGRARATVSQEQALDPNDAGVSADVGEPQNLVAGAPQMAGEVAKGAAGDCTLGGDPLAGPTDAQTLPVSYCGPSGEPGLVVDPTRSTGGADPSTQTSGVASDIGVETSGGDPRGPNGIWAGRDTGDLSYEITWGPAGSKGTTWQQQGAAYERVGRMSGEVW